MSTVAKLSLEEYERIVESGVFSGRNQRRVEFIEGELRDMSPVGWLHALVVDALVRWSHAAVNPDDVHVRVQGPIGIPRFSSIPEPDIAWLSPRKHWKRKPQPKHVFLLIEVADTSLDYDRSEKAELYARAGIRDYWIVNIPDRCIEVYREPRNGHYRSLQTFGVGQRVSPLQFPDAVLEIATLFPAE